MLFFFAFNYFHLNPNIPWYLLGVLKSSQANPHPKVIIPFLPNILYCFLLSSYFLTFSSLLFDILFFFRHYFKVNSLILFIFSSSSFYQDLFCCCCFIFFYHHVTNLCTLFDFSSIKKKVSRRKTKTKKKTLYLGKLLELFSTGGEKYLRSSRSDSVSKIWYMKVSVCEKFVCVWVSCLYGYFILSSMLVFLAVMERARTNRRGKRGLGEQRMSPWRHPPKQHPLTRQLNRNYATPLEGKVVAGIKALSDAILSKPPLCFHRKRKKKSIILELFRQNVFWNFSWCCHFFVRGMIVFLRLTHLKEKEVTFTLCIIIFKYFFKRYELKTGFDVNLRLR